MTAVTPDLSDLSGRTAVVTGGSRGIGYAIAAELLSRGASVTITARKPEELAAAAEKLAADVPARSGYSGWPATPGTPRPEPRR
jgi:NAD(P)-dependent dehydrogenase (short-subunit alcohol dehydrogenase family)